MNKRNKQVQLLYYLLIHIYIYIYASIFKGQIFKSTLQKKWNLNFIFIPFLFIFNFSLSTSNHLLMIFFLNVFMVYKKKFINLSAFIISSFKPKSLNKKIKNPAETMIKYLKYFRIFHTLHHIKAKFYVFWWKKNHIWEMSVFI